MSTAQTVTDGQLSC